ncbi:DUF2812 domain-containing protein [Anaerotignum sp.]
MKKTIRLMPYSIYEAPALAEWFSAQSEKGLFLDSANWIFAVFSKREPQKTKYHLEVITGQDAIPSAELLESYSAFGWEYLSCMSGLYHIFATVTEKPAELHTDPIVQSLAFEKIEKRVSNGFFTCILLMLYILFANGATLRSGVFTLTAIVSQNLIPFFLADFLLILLFFFGRLLPFLQIRKQMKALRNGSFPEVRIRRKLHSGYCHLGVFLCLCVMIFYTMTIATYTSVEEAMAQQGHIPFVTLEEIEGLPPVYPINYSDPADFPEEDDYLYSEDRSLLAPKQFILRQDEAEPLRNNKEPSYLWMHYIEVSLPFLAEPLYQDRIKELLPEDAVPVSVSAFSMDEMQAYETSEGVYFFLREGNKTLCIQHHGTGNPLPYAERFAAFLEEENPWPFLSE